MKPGACDAGVLTIQLQPAVRARKRVTYLRASPVLCFRPSGMSDRVHKCKERIKWMITHQQSAIEVLWRSDRFSFNMIIWKETYLCFNRTTNIFLIYSPNFNVNSNCYWRFRNFKSWRDTSISDKEKPGKRSASYSSFYDKRFVRFTTCEYFME